MASYGGRYTQFKNKMIVDIHNLKKAVARELSLHTLLFKMQLIKVSSKNGDCLSEIE